MAKSPVLEPDTASSQKPLQVFRLRGISASVFANQAKSDDKDRTFHKVSVQRAYKDGAEWKHTSAFGRDDLPVLQTVLARAWEFILDQEAARAREEHAE